MPIYEYRCRACDEEFETIVSASTVPACPGCQSEDLEKQLSVFAVGADKAGASANTQMPCSPAACGSCCHGGGSAMPGACGGLGGFD